MSNQHFIFNLSLLYINISTDCIIYVVFYNVHRALLQINPGWVGVPGVINKQQPTHPTRSPGPSHPRNTQTLIYRIIIYIRLSIDRPTHILLPRSRDPDAQDIKNNIVRFKTNIVQSSILVRYISASQATQAIKEAGNTTLFNWNLPPLARVHRIINTRTYIMT